MRHSRQARLAGQIVSVLIGALLPFSAALSRQAADPDGSGACGGLDIRQVITVAAPLEKVFEFWSDYDNFPRFMSRVRQVRALEGRRSHWIASTPANVPIEWISELTNVVPNSLIEWRTEPGTSVRHEGKVRFDLDGDWGTRVSVRLCYLPSGGALGQALAAITDPKGDMEADLKRMKGLLESG